MSTNTYPRKEINNNSLFSLFSKNQIHPKKNFQQSTSKQLTNFLKLDKTFCIDSETPQGCFFCLDFDDSAEKLATSIGRNVQIFDVNSGNLIQNLAFHQEIVTAIVWANNLSPETNDCFFTSSLDRSIVLWKDYEPVITFTEHQDWIRSLALSKCNDLLISGCVSSVICGFDLQTNKHIFKLQDAHSPEFTQLNSINCLDFSQDDRVFASGGRDGIVKLWDTRILNSGCITSIRAHTSKINSVQFGLHATTGIYNGELLTAGRDSSLRLWDLRTFKTIRNITPQDDKVSDGCISSYSAHTCTGYNVGSTFYNFDNNLVTGSEDNLVYVYDKLTGKHKVLAPKHQFIVHLVSTSPKRDDPILATSSIENENESTKRVLSSMMDAISEENTYQENQVIPMEEDANENLETVEQQERALVDIHRSSIESLMHKYGEKILSIFHTNNFTCSADSNWGSLLNSVADDSPQLDLLVMINDMAADFSRAFDMLQNHISQNQFEAIKQQILDRQRARETRYDVQQNQDNA